jgi:hypothetical protein
MLKESADAFVQLGIDIADAKLLYLLETEENFTDDPYGNKILSAAGIASLRADFAKLIAVAKRLKLPSSQKLLGRRMVYDNNLPQNLGAFEVLLEVISDELDSKLFLSVSTNRAAYYEKDDLLGKEAREAFPIGTLELRSAANAYALELPTASVFHSMRAVEHGLRALATDVGLTFDAQQWGVIIDQIEAKIELIRQHGIHDMSKSDKDARLQFLSEAAKEFAYFKDGWRNYVSHAKATYGQQQAQTVLNHVRDFLRRLSTHLKE